MITPETVEQAYKQYYQDKYPNYPANRTPSYRSCYARKKPANKLTAMIVDAFKYLPNSGHFKGFANRVNVMGVYNPKTKRYRPSGSTPGAADISAMINGVRVEIEVKIGKDRLSEKQIKFRDNITAAGGQYWVVRSWEDFLEQLNTYLYATNPNQQHHNG